MKNYKSTPRKKLFSQVEELGLRRWGQLMGKNSPGRKMAGSDFIIFRFDENASLSLFSVYSLFMPTYFNVCQRTLHGKHLGLLGKLRFKNLKKQNKQTRKLPS